MDSDDYSSLAAKDKRYVWHPFTPMQDYAAGDPLIVARGAGIKLIDVNGRAYYDGISSLWVNVHGHRVPEIDAAIRDQLDRVAHSTLLGHANVPSILLAEQLIGLAPPGLTKVFYSDSGSEAVEIALKMAFQFWRLQGQERPAFVKMTDAYHGDTIGAVSAGGIDLFHATYRPLLFPTLAAPYPHPFRFPGTPAACREHCLRELERLLAARHREVAGVIVEPMVQGAAGMIMMPDGFMRGLAQLCRQFDVLLLADEVATGFGRTGRMFACEHEGVEPDLMMVAKGLTGGYLPLAATLATERVYAAFLGPAAERKTFFHGHSYTGNQLGCAAALANVELFRRHRLVEAVARRAERLADLLEPIGRLPHVGQVRQKGFMVGIELQRDPANRVDYDGREQMAARVGWRCRELGMISRPLGDVVVFMPPLASREDELAAMVDILCRAIQDVTGP